MLESIDVCKADQNLGETDGMVVACSPIGNGYAIYCRVENLCFFVFFLCIFVLIGVAETQTGGRVHALSVLVLRLAMTSWDTLLKHK